MSSKAVKVSRTATEVGQHIFIYAHIRTNQIIYSLTRTINNNAALKQFPYLGKRTVPTSIRKDFWQPLATVTFPSGPQGLTAFQQLREYRKRHEHEWTAPRCKPRKLVGRELRDQKANSIADLAAVLLTQEKIAIKVAAQSKADQARNDQAMQEAQARLTQLLADRKEARSQKDKERFTAAKREKMKLKKKMAKPEPWAALQGEYSLANDTQLPAKRGPGRLRGKKAAPPVTMEGIKIAWANLLDAEFAATWPSSVVHDDMITPGTRMRYVPPKPEAIAGSAPQAKAVVEEVLEEQSPKDLVVPVKQADQTEWDNRTTMQKLVDRLRFGKGR